MLWFLDVTRWCVPFASILVYAVRGSTYSFLGESMSPLHVGNQEDNLTVAPFNRIASIEGMNWLSSISASLLLLEELI